MLASVSHDSARAWTCSLNFGDSLAISISTRARLRQSSENCMLRTLRMGTNELIKINAFAAPAHIEFRPTGRVIRVRNGDKSPTQYQRERLDRLHRHASQGQQDQSISSDRKNDYGK